MAASHPEMGEYSLKTHKSIVKDLNKRYGQKNVKKARRLARDVSILGDNASDVSHLAGAYNTAEKAGVNSKRIRTLANSLEKLHKRKRRFPLADAIRSLTEESISHDFRTVKKAIEHFEKNPDLHGDKLKKLVKLHVSFDKDVKKRQARFDKDLENLKKESRWISR